MTESALDRTAILKQLTTEHPEACRLVVQLVKAIDHEKRQKEAGSDFPRGEVASFDLASLNSVMSATLENLAMNDVTPMEFDHGAHVLQGFFLDLASQGFSLESEPLTEEQQKDLIAKQLGVGVEVELKDPGHTSAYDHSFTGHVVKLNEPADGDIRVEDMEGNQFDVELGEIAAVVTP